MEIIKIIIVQSLAVIAWVVLMMSYYRENTNKILVYQIIAATFYALHYLFLGAYSGFFICIFEAIRDFGYYKTNYDNYIFYFSIPVYIIISIFNYAKPIDILPAFCGITDSYFLTKEKRIVVLGAIISYTCWIIYDYSVGSYAGVITQIMLIISNFIILILGKKK